MKVVRVSAIGVAALLGLDGCKSLEDGAKEAFARDFSCPESRITVRPRDDLNAYDLTFGGMATSPPPEVKRDPERLAIWQKQKQDERASWNTRISVFEARGCDHDVLYTCSHPNGRRGGENFARASCTKANNQPSSAKK